MVSIQLAIFIRAQRNHLLNYIVSLRQCHIESIDIRRKSLVASD